MSADRPSPRSGHRDVARLHQHGQCLAERIVETAPVVVLMLDTAGRLIYCNPFTETLTGFSLEEVQGRDFFATLLPEVDRAELEEVFRQAIARGETCNGGGPIVTRDGQYHEIAWSNRPVKDEAGDVLGVLALGWDLTNLKHSQQKAVQSQRLAAIGQMVTGLAHESRNALQRSQACLEMLAEEVKDRPEALDLVYRIQIAQDHLHYLYEDVRTYAAPIVLHREPQHLDEILQTAWGHLEPIWKERSVRLCRIDSGESWICVVDRMAIESIFRNLLENSLAACPDPVEINVAFDDTEIDGHPAVRAIVRDNGPGLTAEQKQKVFQPFYTTKTRGTGLGMAISRRLVEAHGGQVSVGGGEESGAEFHVTLPRE